MAVASQNYCVKLHPDDLVDEDEGLESSHAIVSTANINNPGELSTSSAEEDFKNARVSHS